MKKQKLMHYLTIYNEWNETARKILSACSLNTKNLKDPKGFPNRSKFTSKIVNLYTKIVNEIHKIRQIIKNSKLEEVINNHIVLEKFVDTKTGLCEKQYRILCKSKELAELIIKYFVGKVNFEPHLVKTNYGWICKIK